LNATGLINHYSKRVVTARWHQDINSNEPRWRKTGQAGLVFAFELQIILALILAIRAVVSTSLLIAFAS